MNPVPPPFEKYNQHYVPQFWQKGFADSRGNVWARYRKEVDPIFDSHPSKAGIPRVVSTRDTMTGLYTYTVFDSIWRPSDDVENALSMVEGHIAKVIDAVADPATPLTDKLRTDLCWAVGLSASRMPHAMARQHRRLKQLVAAIARVHEYANPHDFADMLRHDFATAITEEEFEHFAKLSQAELDTQVTMFEALSPQNPILPEQSALLGTDPIAQAIEKMDLVLLGAAGPGFILGDTPQPDAALLLGFSIPLTKGVALRAEPSAGTPIPFSRRSATTAEVDAINQWQYDNSLEVVIGPDPKQLAAFV